MKKTNSVTKTARAEFLAQNPKAAKLQKAIISKFLTFADGYFCEMKTVSEKFVTGAENARMAGTYLREYADTIPGHDITIDIYQQEKHLFVRPNGLRIDYDTLQWFLRMGKPDVAPFKLIGGVFPVSKQLLIFSGELTPPERGPQSPHIPPEPTVALKAYFDSSLAETIAALRSNVKYCPGGHLRPDLKPLLFEDLKPKLAAWDDSREWLRQELGC